MLLKKLIKDIPLGKSKIIIKGLAFNSKKIKKNFIFFAIKGLNVNGEDYIEEAIKNGASVVVCSDKCKYKNKDILIIKSADVRNLLSDIASKFYKLKPKNIIAVTGTNGKTSVADLFYQILKLNNIPVASVGTLGVKYKNKIIKSDLTSPDTIFLHKTLETLKKNKVDNVIIEASSHGLSQKRLNHLNLKAGIFTNFSQDHLDYHKSMKNYLGCKLKLFNEILPQKKTIITDKDLKEFYLLKKISKKRNLSIRDIEYIKNKLIKKTDLKLNDFQFKNLSMAIIAATLCNLQEKKIFNNLSKIKNVDGRLEHVKTFSNNVKVFVDFAHTPDALLKSIKALRDTCSNEISLVFGCGGDRDSKKRPLMAKIASNNCKKIYVTDDNPRSENPKKIRDILIKNIKNNNSYNIGDRAKAIKTAILDSELNDVILVAGKGHERQQIYKNKTYLVSDKKIIKNIKIKNNRSILKQNFNQNKAILEYFEKKKIIKNFHGISIDSRTLKKDNLFLTIKGKKNNGIKFIDHALKKGAKYIVTSKPTKNFKKKIIKVADEAKFLNYYASKKRELTKAKIIAITGSAGKTSLKNLTSGLLQKFGKTFSSPKSYNNHLGVPLSLSQLNTKHKYGVFEIGMSKAGEINKLSKLVRPHIGIITNIGEAHIENFKNLNEIAKAKGEIIDNIEQNGTIILNRDDKFFNFLNKKSKLKNLKVLTFGTNKRADVYPVSIIHNKSKILIVNVKNQKVKIKFKHINIYNILSALALIYELKLSFKKIYHYIKNLEPSDGRGKIHIVRRYNKKFTLVDESYNANPLSVKIALKNFNSIKKYNFKKFLLLGDMLELGKKSEFLHKNLSKVINNSDVDKVFVGGNKILTTYKNINISKRGNIFQHPEDVDFIFKNIISNNDYLMIKGSNATGLNMLSNKMIKGL